MLLQVAEDDDDEDLSDVDDDDEVLTQFTASVVSAEPLKKTSVHTHSSSSSSSAVRTSSRCLEANSEGDATSALNLATTELCRSSDERLAPTIAVNDRHLTTVSHSGAQQTVPPASSVVDSRTECPPTRASAQRHKENNNNNGADWSCVAGACSELANHSHLASGRPEEMQQRESNSHERPLIGSSRLEKMPPSESAELEIEQAAAGVVAVAINAAVKRLEAAEMAESELVRQDSDSCWVTELSVRLSSDETPARSSVGVQARQIAVTSAAAAAAAATSSPLQQPGIASCADISFLSTTSSLDSCMSYYSAQTSFSDDTPFTAVYSPQTAAASLLATDSIPATSTTSTAADTPEIHSHVTPTPSNDTAALACPAPEVVKSRVTSRPETETDQVDHSAVAKPEVAGDVASRRETVGEICHVTAEPDEVATSSSSSISGRGLVRRERTIRREERHHDDVSESYDSQDDDLDPIDSGSEVGQGQGEGRGVGWRRKRAGRLFEADGRGYVYVMTDTPTNSPAAAASNGETSVASAVNEHGWTTASEPGCWRVKVAGSRQPESRLRQAQLFNIDMRLVTAVRVSRRLAAACRLRQSLGDCAIAGTVDWLRVDSLDVAINAAMDVARQFAPEPSDTDQQ